MTVPHEPHYTASVSEPARRRAELEDPAQPEHPPVVDEDPPVVAPGAIDRANRPHRARRRARVEHRQRARHASLRFWLVLWLLLFASVVLALTIWGQVQSLFGL
jgi:hypothetical protein